MLVDRPKLRLIASETGRSITIGCCFSFDRGPEIGSDRDNFLTGPRETREGRLDWLSADGLAEETIPQVERKLLPYIVAKDSAPPYFARIHFAPDNSIAEMAVHPMELEHS